MGVGSCATSLECCVNVVYPTVEYGCVECRHCHVLCCVCSVVYGTVKKGVVYSDNMCQIPLCTVLRACCMRRVRCCVRESGVFVAMDLLGDVYGTVRAVYGTSIYERKTREMGVP